MIQKIILNILYPIVLHHWYTLESLCLLPTQTNYIVKAAKDKQTILKKACFSQDLCIDHIKAAGKKYNVTINDILMTILSKSIKEFLVSKGDNETKNICLALPFSLRNPTNGHDFQFDNQFSALPIQLQLCDNFEKGLPVIKKDMDAMKVSPAAFCYNYLVKV